MNPNPLSLTVTLAVMDAMNGAPVAEQVLRIVGRGTGEFAFARDTLAQWPQTVSFAYRFDRQVSHMKPILFRSFAGGVVTCNHT